LREIAKPRTMTPEGPADEVEHATRSSALQRLVGTVALEVVPGYASGMKTAVSLPDDLFEAADSLAERLGVSRSELYARAVAEYLAKHRDENVTERLNEVYADEASGLDPSVRSAQARSVSSNEW